MFVMEHCHLSYEDALHMVQNRRYCISPNGGFMTQIKVRGFLHFQLLSIQCDPHYCFAIATTCRNMSQYTVLA